MAKKLQKPDSMKLNGRTGITAKTEDEELVKKRELAKKMAQEKARARTMARQQVLAERIASASEELVAGVEESGAAAQEFARLMNNVTREAEQSGTASGKMYDACIQLNSAAVDFERVMNSVLNNSEIGIKASQGSMEILGSVGNLFKKAADKNVQSAKRIGELEVQSQRIGDIVQAVVMIADQTNLLALNAAIEAARAGEHGRGFAVVADEVRNLAETSERSAKDIRGVVDEISNGVNEVVKDINATAAEFESMASGFEEVVGNCTGTADLLKEYGAKTLEQKNLVNKLVENANKLMMGSESISSATAEVAVGTKEISSAVNEQTRALAEVSTASQELSEMADELKTSTDINKSAEEVAATAEQLSANVEELSSSAAQIASSLVQMNDAIQTIYQENKNAQQLTETGQEIIASTEDIASLSKTLRVEFNELWTKVRAKAREIAQRVQKTMQSYKDINIAIEKLQDKIRRIEKIVDTIQNVSIQTNMLAVNGFVEAATAGEYGRGFSVVAGDIRSLANESAENADKIQDLVRDIHNQMTKVIADINQSEAASHEATTDVPRATVTNMQVTEALEQMNELGASLRDVLNNIKAGAEITKQQVQAVAEIVERSNEQTNQATQLAQEQARAIDELACSIEEIASIADEMQNH